MVPTWRKAKCWVFELPVLLMVPRPIIYGKGKGCRGVAPVSWPPWPPTTSLSTPKVENGKRPTTEVSVSISLHVVAPSPALPHPSPSQDPILPLTTVVKDTYMVEQSLLVSS